MHTPPAVSAATPAPLSASRILLIELALAVGSFAIGTSEFCIMGLMPNIAHSFAVSEPEVGHLISAYALGVVVGAPLISIFAARLPRRQLLILLMCFFAVGNLASALAPDYGSMMAARFISGLPHGAYFGIASLVVAALAPPNQRARAVSRVMTGLTVATLIGNPLATLFGQRLDWRIAYLAVAALALLCVVLVTLQLPRRPDEARSHPRQELRALGNAQVWLTLAIAAIGFAGMFCVFSYLAPTMLYVTQVSEGWIALGMAAFGLGAVLGNMAGGWLFDRFQFAAAGLVLLWSILVLLLFPLAAESLWTLIPVCAAVGSMVALGPPLQIHLMDIAAEAQTLAAASNHAAFNVANALGPWLGGLAIGAGMGWTATAVVGAATAAAGLGIWQFARRRQGQS